MDALARLAAAVALAVTPTLTACGAIPSRADAAQRTGNAPLVATQPPTDGSFVLLGPSDGTLDEAAGRRLLALLTTIILAGAGAEAAGEPEPRTAQPNRWTSRVWLRPSDRPRAGLVSITVHADADAAPERPRPRRDATETSYLVSGPRWTVMTSSASDDALVRRYLTQAAGI